MSQNFDSQLTCVDVTDSENDEFTKTYEKSNFVDSSSLKNSIKGARCQISKNSATVENLKTFKSNLPDTSIPRIQSTEITTEQRLSNVCSMEKGNSQLAHKVLKYDLDSYIISYYSKFILDEIFSLYQHHIRVTARMSALLNKACFIQLYKRSVKRHQTMKCIAKSVISITLLVSNS